MRTYIRRKPVATKYDHEEVIKLYKEVLSYREVGRRFGLSGERVRQLKERYCPEVKPTRTHIIVENCLECNKPNNHKSAFYGGLCQSCNFKKRYVPKIPKIGDGIKCVECKKKFTATGPHRKSPRGKCRRCYDRIKARLPSVRASQKKWKEKNKERVLEYQKKASKNWQLKNRDKFLKKSRESYYKRRDKNLKYFKDYYEKNKEERKEYNKKHYLENREKIRQYSREYHKKHYVKKRRD